jgi:hypothetical protein
LIYFFLIYVNVDDKLVANTAIRLELAITAGENPIYVNTGVMTIPPPTPISEPIIPEPNPIMTKIMNSSIKLFFLYLEFHQVDKLKFILSSSGYKTSVLFNYKQIISNPNLKFSFITIQEGLL